MNIRRWITGMLVAAGVMAMAVPAMSQQRDDDGTRMQARQVDVGSEHSDRLDPPRQEADWRMIRLEEDHHVELTLSIEPTEHSATLTLTGARGDELDAAQAGGEDAEISASLDAGIYYIAVESSDTLEYDLSIE